VLVFYPFIQPELFDRPQVLSGRIAMNCSKAIKLLTLFKFIALPAAVKAFLSTAR
jgi:hypothetical protein